MRYSLTEFRCACVQYLSTISLMSLRSYGRHVGVAAPTEKKKLELIDEIVGILTGELQPVARATKGAPVKDDFVDPKIELKIAQLRREYLTEPEPNPIGMFTSEERESFLVFNDSAFAENEEDGICSSIFRGQLESFKNVPCLLPLDGDLQKPKLVIRVEDIHAKGLCEGDVVACYAEQYNDYLLVSKINTINGLVVGTGSRFKFEEEPLLSPNVKLPIANNKNPTAEEKYLDWLLPIGIGQRCLVSSSPKTGKSNFLFNLMKSISRETSKYEVFALLIDQSPELIARYRNAMPSENVIATTYDADADMHVFMAEFMLKRMKRFAEVGRNVILIVDSLSKIAHAYNDTEFSMGGKCLPCGLETKTLHYIKKFLATARSFGEKGSLTMIASVSFGTGDEADDILYSELSAVAGGEIRLCEGLAVKRLFPAIDLLRSHFEGGDALMDQQRLTCDRLLRQKVLPKMEADEVHRLILSCDSLDELCERLEKL